MGTAFLFFGFILGSLWIIGHFIERKRNHDEMKWNEELRRCREENR